MPVSSDGFVRSCHVYIHAYFIGIFLWCVNWICQPVYRTLHIFYNIFFNILFYNFFSFLSNRQSCTSWRLDNWNNCSIDIQFYFSVLMLSYSLKYISMSAFYFLAYFILAQSFIHNCFQKLFLCFRWCHQFSYFAIIHMLYFVASWFIGNFNFVNI